MHISPRTLEQPWTSYRVPLHYLPEVNLLYLLQTEPSSYVVQPVEPPVSAYHPPGCLLDLTDLQLYTQGNKAVLCHRSNYFINLITTTYTVTIYEIIYLTKSTFCC